MIGRWMLFFARGLRLRGVLRELSVVGSGRHILLVPFILYAFPCVCMVGTF